MPSAKSTSLASPSPPSSRFLTVLANVLHNPIYIFLHTIPITALVLFGPPLFLLWSVDPTGNLVTWIIVIGILGVHLIVSSKYNNVFAESTRPEESDSVMDLYKTHLYLMDTATPMICLRGAP